MYFVQNVLAEYGNFALKSMRPYACQPSSPCWHHKDQAFGISFMLFIKSFKGNIISDISHSVS